MRRRILTIIILSFILQYSVFAETNRSDRNDSSYDDVWKLLEQELYDEAIISCDEIIKSDPNIAIIYVYRARAYYKIR